MPKEKAAKVATHYVVLHTQARLSDGNYAPHGATVKAESFGDSLALHLERGAIRAATAEEAEEAE